MIKKEIRKIVLEKRLQLSPEELQDKTTSIVDHFKTLDISTVKYLLSYYPLRERNEFDVSLCEKIIKEKESSVQIAWPKIAVNNTSMEAHLIESNKLFIKNKFNILEPLDGDIIPPNLLDMIFVPMIAFDPNGFRVGYGRGYYDRFLPSCSPGVVKIGFSFFEPIDKIDDINEFDVPLNLCITSTCIYEF